MRTLSFVIFLTICSVNLFSQENIFPIDSITGKITYIKIDSVNNQELYVRAHAWVAHSFVSGKDAIQLDDKEAGEIIVKGYFAVSDNVVNPTMMDVHCDGTVDFTLEFKQKMKDISMFLLIFHLNYLECENMI